MSAIEQLEQIVCIKYKKCVEENAGELLKEKTISS